MPAAASENQRGELFGVSPANRRCRERRAVIGRLQASRKVRRESPILAAKPEWVEREHRKVAGRKRGPQGQTTCKRSMENRPWNRQVEGRAPPEPIRPPDGTRRRRELPGEGCRFANGRKAGSGWNGQTHCNDRAPEMEHGFTPKSIRPDATSITMRSTPGAHCTRGCSMSITAARHVSQAGKRRPIIRPRR
jgi:hypothetical protein